MNNGRLNEEVEKLFLSNKKFVLFKKPFQKKINLFAEDSTNISKSGFVINNFENTEKHYIFPSLKLSFNVSDYDKNKIINLKKIEDYFINNRTTYLIKSDYLKKIEKTISLLNNQLSKVVIGRIIKWENSTFNELNHFINLCNNNNSFTYLIYIPNKLCWIGCSPELLLKYKNNKLTTVSLAGTKKPEEKWTNKELEEQQIVTNYINELAIENNLQPIIGKTKTVLVNNKINHLKTIIKLNNISFKQAANFLLKLHPTPAVCGIPKKEAIDIINKIENQSREYYTGYVGIEDKNNLELYVNLRCASIYKDFLNVYVGSGITKKSIPEKEWEETELKSKTIISND